MQRPYFQQWTESWTVNSTGAQNRKRIRSLGEEEKCQQGIYFLSVCALTCTVWDWMLRTRGSSLDDPAIGRAILISSLRFETRRSILLAAAHTRALLPPQKGLSQDPQATQESSEIKRNCNFQLSSCMFSTHSHDSHDSRHRLERQLRW